MKKYTREYILIVEDVHSTINKTESERNVLTIREKTEIIKFFACD